MLGLNVKKFLKIYSLAFQSLTILWPGIVTETSVKIRAQAMVFYPLVGLFLGVLLNFFHKRFQIILPENIMDFLVIVAWIILSRASHVIGLACILETASLGLKTNSSIPSANSRLGYFAIIVLVLIQLVKFFALIHTEPILKTGIILSMPIMSLWAIIWACYLLSPPTNSFKTHIASEVTGYLLAISSAIAFVLLFLFLKLNVLPGLFMVMLTTFFLIKWIQRKNLELMENTLGASHELGGAIFLLSFQMSLSYKL